MYVCSTYPGEHHGIRAINPGATGPRQDDSHSDTVRMAMPIQTYRHRLHLIPTYYKNKHADGYIHTYKQTYLDIIKTT